MTTSEAATSWRVSPLPAAMGFALAGAEAGVGQDVLHFESPAVAVPGLQFPFDERQQAGFQKFQRLADPLVE